MMNNKINFGSWEGICVLINLILAQALIVFPRDMAKFGGSAGWMIPIIITFIMLIYFSIIAVLYKRIGSLDLLDISERAGGKVFKIIIGLLVSLYLLADLSISLGGFSETLKMVSLDKSPISFVEIIFGLAFLAAAYYGIEAIARINAFLVPVIILGIVLITIGVIPEFKLTNLYPIMGEGFNALGKGVVYKLSAFSSLLLLFFMVPFFKDKYIKRVGFMTILISGALLVWSSLAFLLLFPYQIAVDKKVPIFQMAKHIEFGTFIQRVESIVVLIGSISLMLYLCVVFTFVVYILKKTLNLKKSKPIILALGIIVFVLSDILKRMNIEVISSRTVNLIWLFGLIVPLIILIFGAAKKVGKRPVKGGLENE